MPPGVHVMINQLQTARICFPVYIAVESADAEDVSYMAVQPPIGQRAHRSIDDPLKYAMRLAMQAHGKRGCEVRLCEAIPGQRHAHLTSSKVQTDTRLKFQVSFHHA